MSYINLTVGVVAVAGAAQLVINATLPSVPPIVAHSLTYIDGTVYQDRTVTSEAEFFPAQWKSVIVDAATDRPVPGCSGSGFWPYKSGRITAEIPLDEWVGSDTCTPEYLRGLGGEYIPVASWYWGGESTEKEGAPFRP